MHKSIFVILFVLVSIFLVISPQPIQAQDEPMVITDPGMIGTAYIANLNEWTKLMLTGPTEELMCLQVLNRRPEQYCFYRPTVKEIILTSFLPLEGDYSTFNVKIVRGGDVRSAFDNFSFDSDTSWKDLIGGTDKAIRAISRAAIHILDIRDIECQILLFDDADGGTSLFCN